ncbi:hypothetical protein SG18_04795 [Pandoraea apista]|nr:hypothetical protein PSNIH2_06640 [Pantoea sp. PSNIH2]AJE97648.1 hypothetical protein SG18_04795 [Pandoraea apista]POU44631.1 hypothetical protein C3380_18385 [Pantoea sp. PSNIH5]POU65426.1 hypothetical protein C3374_14630 [Pantoea sp. PSNIH4]POY66876.1 hypothetical protein C3402_16025 [Pantoea sp. PSNIH3]RAY97907.1 hypothetical protein DP195_03620 [Enterobacter asburiae]
MANLHGMKSEDACPGRDKPSGDDEEQAAEERASATACTVAVRVQGCAANGVDQHGQAAS